MRKSVSLFLAAVTAIPTILTALSGCVNASAEDTMTNGELLELINNKFGFEGYESSESYYESVPSSDAYFEAVQTAHDFEVLDELVTDLKTGDVVTREFFAMAASGAIYHDYTDEISISDISDIVYKDDVLTVLNYGIMNLEDGKFEPKKNMSGSECILLLDVAFDIWTSHSIIKPKYDVQLQDGVIDLGGAGMYYYDEASGEMKFDIDTYNQGIQKLKDNNYSYDQNSGIIMLDSVSDFGIETESVMTVPTGDDLNPYSIVKVASVDRDDSGQYKITTVTPEMEELFKEYSVEQTVTPDFSKVSVYDMEGNPIMPSYADSDAAGEMALRDNSITSDCTSSNLVTCANLSKDTHSKTLAFSEGESNIFNIFGHKDEETGLGLNVDVVFTNNSFTVKAGANISSFDKEHGGSDEVKVSTTCSYEDTISNIKFDYRYDFWEGHAKLVLRHDNSKRLSSEGEIKASIPLAQFEIPTGVGDLSIKITPKLNIDADGSFSISVTNSGIANGIEYRRWHGLSKVSDEGTKRLDAKAEVNAEVYLSINVKAKAVCGLLSAGLEISGGAGAIAKEETNTIDIGEQEPILLTCCNVSIYPILKAKVSGEIDFIFGEISDSYKWTVFDKKDIVLVLHFETRSDKPDEGTQLVPECTKAELMNIKKDKETEQAGVVVGDSLRLTENKVRADIASQFTVGIAEVPSGYNYEDIYVKVSDYDVLEINSAAAAASYEAKSLQQSVPGFVGKMIDEMLEAATVVPLDGYNCSFTGKGKGKATITFITKDGKYRADCDVIVFDPNEPLDPDVKLDTYGVTLGENTEYKFNIVKLPWYLTENDIVWSTSDPSIVTVGQDGTVTTVGSGYAMVTASTPDGTSKAYCNITVNNVGQVSFIFIPDKCIEYQI